MAFSFYNFYTCNILNLMIYKSFIGSFIILDNKLDVPNKFLRINKHKLNYRFIGLINTIFRITNII